MFLAIAGQQAFMKNTALVRPGNLNRWVLPNLATFTQHLLPVLCCLTMITF